MLCVCVCVCIAITEHTMPVMEDEEGRNLDPSKGIILTPAMVSCTSLYTGVFL